MIERNRIFIVLAFFIGFLIIGLKIYDNYGVHWDEYANQRFGHKWVQYIQETIQEGYPLKIEADLHKFHSKFQKISNSYPIRIKVGRHDLRHGPVFELFLVVNEKVLNLSDSRDIILMRHLSTFVLFVFSVFIFYLLCKNAFKSWKIGLLGSVFLVAHPRIFSHSFYNSSDIGFLALYIISTYTLIRFLYNKTYRDAFLHALACAILIDIRIAGLILPLCTCLFFGIEIFILGNKKNLIKKIALYIILLAILIFLFWPYLWSDPIENFLKAFTASKFNISGIWLPPWYYNFVWIFVTTPIIYSSFFLIGIFSSFKSVIKSPTKYYTHNKSSLIAISLFILPILLPIVFRTRLYDGWRHHYFVYPMFIFITLIGVKYIFYLSKEYLSVKAQQIINSLIILVIILSLIWTFNFMFKNHPHENTYSNILAGRNKRYVKIEGAIDYWGLSYRKVLEYILANNNGILKVYATNTPGKINAKILLPKDRERLKFVKNEENAKYIITNYRLYEVPDHYEEYYTVKVNGEKIAGAYELKNYKHNENKGN